MKTAVAYLEPHMEKADQGGKGTMVLATVKGDVHDIGKNLVDIILTNNGYTVRNLGIKIGIAEMVAAVEEFGADAIGMSGLLVKSTLIMRENLEELNRRGLSHIPVILGGAALTRTYVERDLRQVYDGRLFYGKDAFEGLRTMDRLVELAQTGEDDPEFGTDLGGRDLGPRKSELRKQAAEEARARGEALPARPRAWPPTTRCSRRPSSGSRVAKGMAIDDIAAYLNETALFRNQWGFRPEARRGRPRVQGPGPGAAARGAGHGQGRAAAGPPGGLGPLRRQRRRRRPGDLDRRVPHRRSGCASPSPARSRTRTCASPTSSGRSTRATRTAPASRWCTMGSRVSEEAARLFAADEYQQYLYLHGLGVEMAEALAEYWHRRIREELGFADEDGPDADRAVPPEVPGRPLLVGLPGLPATSRTTPRWSSCSGADRIGVEVSEGFQLHPEQSTDGHHLPPPPGQVLRRLRAGPAGGRRLGRRPAPWCAASSGCPAPPPRPGRPRRSARWSSPPSARGTPSRPRGRSTPRRSPPARRTRRPRPARWPPWPGPSAPTSGCGRTPAVTTRCRTSWSASPHRSGRRPSSAPRGIRSSPARS